MKRYMSIFGLVLLVSLLVIGLIGCGQPAVDDDAPDDAAPEVDVVKIGFIGPITGPNAYQGVGARNAFEMAVAMANES
ncbi:MAG: hypothetical protein ACNA7Z_08460, partial [Dethiobacteria bacterium]